MWAYSYWNQWQNSYRIGPIYVHNFLELILFSYALKKVLLIWILLFILTNPSITLGLGGLKMASKFTCTICIFSHAFASASRTFLVQKSNGLPSDLRAFKCYYLHVWNVCTNLEVRRLSLLLKYKTLSIWVLLLGFIETLYLHCFRIKQEWDFALECRKKGIPQSAYLKNGFVDTTEKLLDKIAKNSQLCKKSTLSDETKKERSKFIFQLSGEHWTVNLIWAFFCSIWLISMTHLFIYLFILLTKHFMPKPDILVHSE